MPMCAADMYIWQAHVGLLGVFRMGLLRGVVAGVRALGRRFSARARFRRRLSANIRVTHQRRP